MTEQININQSQVESEESTTNSGVGILLDLNNEAANSFIRTGTINDVHIPFAIGIENVDSELGKYSQILAFSSVAGISMYLYGLVELEQEFKEKGVFERISEEEEREILRIAFSANDYLKNADIVATAASDTGEDK